MKYDLLVFIGRFQPFHLGHKQVVQDALTRAKHVLILVGSSYQARTVKNPFTFEERQQMIMSSLDPQDLARTTIRPLRDTLYNNAQWLASVQQLVDVSTCSIISLLPGETGKVGIIGYEKDDSSWYLREFPQWDFVPIKYNERVDATALREIWLANRSPLFAVGAVTSSVHTYMFETFPTRNKVQYGRLCREYEHITNYRKGWEVAPYPPTFVTVDAVVVQSGHLLLVQRKAAPGEGLWALPGGFIDQDETTDQGIIRELRQETGLKVPTPVLIGSIRARKVFDHPGRSLRGRTITHAALIELAHGPLPKVKGGDDADKAKWVTLAEFEKMEDQMFEDHFYIVNFFLGRI